MEKTLISDEELFDVINKLDTSKFRGIFGGGLDNQGIQLTVAMELERIRLHGLQGTIDAHFDEPGYISSVKKQVHAIVASRGFDIGHNPPIADSSCNQPSEQSDIDDRISHDVGRGVRDVESSKEGEDLGTDSSGEDTDKGEQQNQSNYREEVTRPGAAQDMPSGGHQDGPKFYGRPMEVDGEEAGSEYEPRPHSSGGGNFSTVQPPKDDDESSEDSDTPSVGNHPNPIGRPGPQVANNQPQLFNLSSVGSFVPHPPALAPVAVPAQPQVLTPNSVIPQHLTTSTAGDHTWQDFVYPEHYNTSALNPAGYAAAHHLITQQPPHHRAGLRSYYVTKGNQTCRVGDVIAYAKVGWIGEWNVTHYPKQPIGKLPTPHKAKTLWYAGRQTPEQDRMRRFFQMKIEEGLPPAIKIQVAALRAVTAGWGNPVATQVAAPRNAAVHPLQNAGSLLGLNNQRSANTATSGLGTGGGVSAFNSGRAQQRAIGAMSNRGASRLSGPDASGSISRSTLGKRAQNEDDDVDDEAEDESRFRTETVRGNNNNRNDGLYGRALDPVRNLEGQSQQVYRGTGHPRLSSQATVQPVLHSYPGVYQPHPDFAGCQDRSSIGPLYATRSNVPVASSSQNWNRYYSSNLNPRSTSRLLNGPSIVKQAGPVSYSSVPSLPNLQLDSGSSGQRDGLSGPSLFSQQSRPVRHSSAMTYGFHSGQFSHPGMSTNNENTPTMPHQSQPIRPSNGGTSLGVRQSYSMPYTYVQQMNPDSRQPLHHQAQNNDSPYRNHLAGNDLSISAQHQNVADDQKERQREQNEVQDSSPFPTSSANTSWGKSSMTAYDGE